MKLTPIFVSDSSEDGLWSITLAGEAKNEFDKFFDQMNDTEWLHDFFDSNYADLNSGFFGRIDVGKAVLKTVEEFGEMEDLLYDLAEQGFAGGHNSLQEVFKPLNNFEYAIVVHQKSKARVWKGWLRLYAIRLSKNCYLITGGAIKLTQDMRREHLQNELRKLEQTKIFLRSNGIYYPEDLNTYQDE